jgi:TPR repeat protein
MAHSDPFKDAHAAWERGRLKTAFRLFAAQAKAGDSGARLNLGYFYDLGLGIRKNKAQALRWYRLAYRQGSGAAASNIATVYRDEGRPALALAWYKRAASLKDGDAAVEVAKHYLEGSGVRKHRGLAVAALKRAIASRHITEAGREKAKRILKRVQRGAGEA